MKYLSALPILLILGHSALFSQERMSEDELYARFMAFDSLIFEVGFNQCDPVHMKVLIDEDCEFFHDQSGYSRGREFIVNSITEGLCKLPYKATREVIRESVKVYPLYTREGNLYAVLQTGDHKFWARYEGKEPEVTSVAKFSHLWVLKEGEWKLSKVISYDHRG